MGGSTNTVLHLLAAAHEAGVDFTMKDIDRLSRQVPCLCKVAPAKSDVHMEDVHRAGGIMAILGELDRAGLLHTALPTVHSPTMGDALADWDIRLTNNPKVQEFYKAAPGGVPTQTAFSQSRRWDELDTDRENGVIRSKEHAFSQDGGLAVLYGNIARDGCIVKTAGVDDKHPEILRPGAGLREPGRGGRRDPRRRGRPKATSSSSATKGRAAGRACRKCSTRPATSNRRAWGRPAR